MRRICAAAASRVLSLRDLYVRGTATDLTAGAAATPWGFDTARAGGNARGIARVPRAVPPYWQLVGFSALFATGGFIIQQGDVLNGSGVVTGACLARGPLTRSVVADLPLL